MLRTAWRFAVIDVDAWPRSYAFNGPVNNAGHGADNTACRLNRLQPNFQFQRGGQHNQRFDRHLGFSS